MIKVAVIFGSMSHEHEISCKSAYNVIQNLDKSKYEINKIGIDKEGNFYKVFCDEKYILDGNWINTKDIDYIENIFKELKKYDCILPILHGMYGEDGTIQGILDFAKVKYIGCKTLGSAIGIDKIICKEMVKEEKINVVPSISLNSYKFNENELEEVKLEIEKINYPVIVKPNKEGSSFGVKKANNYNELLEAVKYAFDFDTDILIEKFIKRRREIECAYLIDYASTPGEIKAANEFYDYEAKYENKESYVEIPAKISDENIQKIKEYSHKIFKKLRLNGISRIDFFLDEEDNEIYFNEVNTLPGFTDISMYPKMLNYDGITYSEILDKLINYELKK